MATVMVFLHYNGNWENNCYTKYEVAGLMLPKDCTFDDLCALVLDKLKIKAAAAPPHVLEMKYQVKDDYPAIRINDESSLEFYIHLKARESDITKFPICATVVADEPELVPEPEPSGSTARMPDPDFGSRAELTDNSDTIEITPFPKNFLAFAQGAASMMAEAVASTANDSSSILPNGGAATENDGTNIEKMAVGTVFQNKSILQKKLSLHAIHHRFQFKVEKSCQKQYYVRCFEPECKWYVKASRVGNCSLFKIRSVVNEHTCPEESRTNDLRQATATLVGDCIKQKFTSLKTAYRPSDIIQDMRSKYGIELNYKKAWRSRQKAMEVVRGKVDESYAYVDQYLQKLCKSNPGSFVKLCATTEGNFKYAFMSLNASIKGWDHCRPIIVIDGVFLKSAYGGILLTASAQDGNSDILPIAFSVVDFESNESYLWFFVKLKDAIGTRPGLCFVSDENEGIKNAIEKVYPDAAHCLSTYHIANNLRSKKNSSAVKESFNAAARAYTENDFDYHMSELKNMDPRVPTYLRKIGIHKWARVHSTTNKYFTMTSNVAESINSATRLVRDLPITTLLESLRALQQEWNVKNRDEAKSMSTTLTKRASAMLEANYKIDVHLTFQRASDEVYRVSTGAEVFVVNLELKSCTCNRFQMDELPCPHALKVIASRNLDPLAYCSNYYRTSVLVSTYATPVFPVDSSTSFTNISSSTSTIIKPPFGR